MLKPIKHLFITSVFWAKKKTEKTIKKKARKTNPEKIDGRLKTASKLFEDFTGHDAIYIDEHQTHAHKNKIGVRVGTIDFLTIKSGQDVFNLKFNAPRPVFGVSHDGLELFIVGGQKNTVQILKRLGLDCSKNVVDIGTVLALAYTTKRDNVKESYIHQFLPASRGRLVYEKGEFLIKGGRFIFIDSGINDR